MDRDDTDPWGPAPVMLDLEPAEEPDPSEIPEARRVEGFEEGRTDRGTQRNENWQGGVVTMIILAALFAGFRGINQGNLALMVASAVVCIVVPVAFFVGVIGYRSGSATKDTNTNKKGDNK